jgi:hypothetical protein
VSRSERASDAAARARGEQVVERDRAAPTAAEPRRLAPSAADAGRPPRGIVERHLGSFGDVRGERLEADVRVDPPLPGDPVGPPGSNGRPERARADGAPSSPPARPARPGRRLPPPPRSARRGRSRASSRMPTGTECSRGPRRRPRLAAAQDEGGLRRRRPSSICRSASTGARYYVDGAARCLLGEPVRGHLGPLPCSACGRPHLGVRHGPDSSRRLGSAPRCVRADAALPARSS